MKRKHFFTAWNARNPRGLPRKNEAETAATSQRHNYVAMNTVYPTWNPVSTASQEEAQIPADIDGAAVQEAAANLRQELEHLKQATAELHSTLLEMQEAAEKNHGEIPDVNRIAEEVLVQSRKGEDEP